MTELTPLRSVLYMPSSNERALEKAKSIACDGLILDLEDAVAPDAKPAAREAAAAAAASGEYGRRTVTIRVNSIGTEWQTWEATLINRYTNGFTDTPNPWTASDPSLVEGVRRVGAFSEWDISAAFTGFKNTRIGGGVINIFDTTPPLSLTNGTNNQYEQVGFAPLYTARGRFFHIEASYSFK